MIVVTDAAPGDQAATGLPRYRQIANALRDQIQRREWSTNDRLPGEEQLAVQFGVSKLTMRQALGVLLSEGLIRRVHGKGTFVTDFWQPTTVLTSARPLDAIMLDTPSWRVQVLDTGLVGGPRSEFEDLDLAPLGSAFRLRRVHLVEDRPQAYVVSYLPPELSEQLQPADFEQVPFIVALEARAGQPFVQARQRITAALAEEETATRLQLAVGSAILLIHRTYYLAGDKVAYVAHSRYPGGQFLYETRLTRVAGADHHLWSRASHDAEHF
jgi:GntR family transcriptional regulator